MKIAIAMSLGACAWAQSGLDRPTLGTMLDATGATRPVYGVAGSVTLGDVAATGVLSTACSQKVCLAKTDSSIISLTQSIDAPPGPALFALDGDAAFVYFPQSNRLARWHDGQLDPLDFDVDGEILSLRAVQGTLEFAARRRTGVWIVRDGNSVVDSLPRATKLVMLLKSGVLFSVEDGLMLRRPDGAWVRFVVRGVEALLALGEDYVQIRAGGSTYALRVTPGREQLFLIPEPPQ
jgi:hypothetical protein